MGNRILSSAKFSRLLSSQPVNLIIQSYPVSESRDEILFRGEGCDTQVISLVTP
jgi:hypothetical protein